MFLVDKEIETTISSSGSLVPILFKVVVLRSHDTDEEQKPIFAIMYSVQGEIRWSFSVASSDSDWIQNKEN